MASQWDTWLGALKAAGKGGLRYTQLQIDRGLAYSKVLSFGLDVSADAFLASLKSSPDGAALSPACNFTITVGSYTSGTTEITLSLTNTQTAALPADSDIDGVEDFVFDLVRNGERFMGGLIPVAGKVT